MPEIQPLASNRLTPYQKRLFVFLSVATFFEGYDFLALAQILPNLRDDFGLSKMSAGFLFAFVNFGTVVAYLLVRRADRWGRRKIMTITIAGYTISTFLTGLSPNVYWFAFFQFMGRIFLIGEWVVSTVYAAEEFPARKRGMVIGVLQAFSSLGSVLCAGLTPLLLQTTFGWRSVYFVGIVPLCLLAVARRSLKETRRFQEQVGVQSKPRPMAWVFKTPYRKRVLQMGAIWFMTYACSNTAVSFWKEFAVNERGLTDSDVGVTLTIASLAAMPLVFFAGKLLDVIGRRPGALVIFSSTAAGVFFAYYAHSQWALTFWLAVAIFGVSAVLPVLNAYTTELFPTDLRGDAFAWSNNLLGRAGYVFSPLIIGAAAEIWSWGAAIRPTAFFPLVALVLIYWLLPETMNKELEETSAIEAPGG